MQRFPNIFKNLQDLGFDVPEQRVPISPAFHYAIGGIKSDLNGRVPHVKGLYAIGEAVDVTGWLGGYNFQWAWASGWAAGQEI